MKAAAIVANVGLRAAMVYFLVEVFLNPEDPRFAGKAIAPRNAIILGIYSLVFPALHLVRAARGRRHDYPWATDALYLSIPALDMAGNSFDLYDRYFYFDLVPHAHGPGAATIVLMEAARMPLLSAFGVVQTLHILMEAQEYYTDVFLGTHNVRGAFDTVNDLLAGVVGAVAYGVAWQWLRGRLRR